MASQLDAWIDAYAADGEFAAFVRDVAAVMQEHGMDADDLRRAMEMIAECPNDQQRTA